MLRKMILTVIALLATVGLAQEPLPLPSPLPPAPPMAADITSPGVIQLAVDATDLDHHIFRVHEVIPVSGGQSLTLFYPQWLPGKHSPAGPLADMGGLTITAAGRPVAWTRDTVDVFAFHLQPPADAEAITVDFQYLSPVEPNEGRIVVTPEMLSLQWNALSLYPAGFFTRRIPVAAQVRLPEGWGWGCALDALEDQGDALRFKTVSYDQLVDSPMLAGRYFKRIALDSDSRRPVSLDIVADRPALLAVTPEQLMAHRSLLTQADHLFGARPFDHYDFLLSVSDRLGGIGVEHHQSSEDGVPSGYFIDWDKSAPVRDLLPHEYAHSWNGKMRRPADLWTPTFNQPMQDSLLWVYEGQTQYWGFVLAARAGLLSPAQVKDAIALTAATYDHVPGRVWKNLQDTTNDPIVARRRPQPWRNWRRSEDYYSEGALVWLDVDTLIRQKSSGRRSLDDFAQAFFGQTPGGVREVTYRFEDVVEALARVQPYDWASFLRERLDGHGPGAPLDGLARGGYRLVYDDKPSDYHKQQMAERKIEDFSFSLGFTIGKDQTFSTVMWDGPAFKAGVTLGAKLWAVNGIAYDKDRLKEAITEARNGAVPIEILVQEDDHFRSLRLDYHDGLRYPHLQREGTGPATLDAILTPK
jgi:predicted metalloprotease with PDZ domain